MTFLKAESDIDLSLLPYSRIPDLKKEDLLSYLKEKDKELYLLKEENHIIGFLASSTSFEESEIDYLAIEEKEEKKGCGSFLLENYLKAMKENGIHVVFLEVRENNQKAIALYEKFLFTIYRKRKNYYLSPVEDALCYRKELVP